MATGSFTVNQDRIKNLKFNVSKSRRMVFEDHSRAWMAGILIAADLFSLLAAILVAMQLYWLRGTRFNFTFLELYGLLAVTLVLLSGRKGLYPAVGLNYVDELRLLAANSSVAFLVMLGITFALKTTSIYSRVVLVLTWLLALAFLPASRYAVRRMLIRWGLWGEPVVIIGNSQKVSSLVEHFKINLQLGLRPVAVLNDAQCAGCALGAHAPDSACSILAQARELSLKTALVVISDLNQIDELVERFRVVFHRVILIKDKNGRYGLNGLESLDLSDVLGLQVKNNLLNPWSQTVKRAIDVLVSFLGLVFLSPFLGLIALWIALDSPGGIFYRQVRLGRDGRAFRLLKFRTMHRGAERILMENLTGNAALRAEWDSYQKLKEDPRITRAGRLLRRFSLDELPQLWNIARGEMSLVGPRPMMLPQRDLYGEAYENYVRVSPGITGLWQVSGRSQTTFARRAELDNEYIQSWSIWLDVYILIKTIKVVFWQDGAY